MKKTKPITQAAAMSEARDKTLSVFPKAMTASRIQRSALNSHRIFRCYENRSGGARALGEWTLSRADAWISAAKGKHVRSALAALKLKGDTFYISKDTEWFGHGPYDTRDEAVTAGRDLWGDNSFYVGKHGGLHEPFSRDIVEDILEQEGCSVSDFAGPGADDNWPPRFGPNDPQVEAANKQIRAIMRKLCGPCTVFTIVDVENISMAA